MAKKKWIQAARKRMEQKGTVGSFRRAAKRAGMDTCAYARKVMNDPKASKTLKRRALFALNTGCRRKR